MRRSASPPDQVRGFRAQKIIFDLQLADLPVQKINPVPRWPFLPPLNCHPRKRRFTVQQLLLPVVDLVRMDSELTCQLGDRPALAKMP